VDKYAIITDISAASTAIPIIVALLRLRTLKPVMKIFLGLIGFALIIEIIAEILTKRCGACFSIVLHIYTPVEYCIYMWIFQTWITNDVVKKAVKLSAPLFVIFAIIYSGFYANLKSLNILTASSASTIYIMLSVYVLLGMFAERGKPVLGLFRFWVCATLFLYSSGSIVFFALGDVWIANYMLEIWYIHVILNFASYCGYAVAFTCKEV